MIISRTPYRVSFFGGGTDYPDWYLRHGGQVLSTTIDKYIYITCRYLPPFFDHKIRLAYSRVETCQSVEELNHPAVKEILKYFQITNGLEIHYDGDLPARSGMGSSSAFSVGLINALYKLLGEEVDSHKLALDAIHVEQDLIGESVGSQDQVNAAYGGFNHIEFSQSGSIVVNPVDTTPERLILLSQNLMLFYTGIVRTAETVSVTYATNTEQNSTQLEAINKITNEAIDVVTSNKEIEQFGELMHQSWLEKKKLSSLVSNTRVDRLYQLSREAGAVGGKLCGAGGGGMMLFYVPRNKQHDVMQALSSFLHVPFEFTSVGSDIIFVSEEEKYQDVRSDKIGGNLKFIELEDL